MRWIKHLTNSWEDEKLSAAVSQCGLEIYGFWWRILEIIGLQMDGTGKNFCCYPDKVWGKFCGISAKKLRNFAGILEKNKLILLKLDGDVVTITVPNLLKYRDEYSQKKARKN